MTENLDHLNNPQLSERFAIEVVQTYASVPLVRGDKARDVVARFHAPEVHEPGMQPRTPMVLRFKDGCYGGDLWPAYAESADTVMPFLNQWKVSVRSNAIHGWHCAVSDYPFGGYYPEAVVYEAYACSFARAVCIALINAQRAKMT